MKDAGVSEPSNSAGTSTSSAGSAGTENSSPSGSSQGSSAGAPATGGNLGSGGTEPTPHGGMSNEGGSTSTTAGSGGSAGTLPIAGGGQSPMDERCDIANLDPAKPPQVLTLSGSLGTHDPVMIAADGRFYLFSTGNNLAAKTSTNMLQWQNAPEVFTSATRPAWIAQAVPGVSNLWAPDISFFGSQYHLYYSASTFGSNHSCIGHLTRPSLSSGTWTDRGQVICSNATGNDNWNAIDPNVIVDQGGTPWLAFGSFWGGIKLIKLTAEGARDGTSLDSLAARPNAGGALEAPFIVRRCGYYYLFTSWDSCCKGASSTYNTRVGRSATLAGPYQDRAGVALMQGGGTLLVQGGERYKGPGHNAVVFTNTAAFNVYHSYDANNNGQSVLRIAEVAWDGEGWPVAGGP
ncbi:MAG TPA: arabinan endo-1,5-alpha-L-arabinosidase [Polyangiaceae bacterium]|nr:arabinan endo-1,5-alpha-L-arabinosidase [Polyangiaceae bacterium]